MEKSALIFGINGQDGYYLSRLLDSEGYEITGTGLQQAAAPGLPERTEYLRCDVSSAPAVSRLIREKKPSEIYNLAVHLSGGKTAAEAAASFAVNVCGTKNILGAISSEHPRARLFHASTAYIFKPADSPHSEASPISPPTFHGKTKLEAHNLVIAARARGVFAVNGILFNHESPRRPLSYLFHKVTRAAAEFKLGMHTGHIELGNLGSVRDWGYAKEYVEAMAAVLRAEKPEDYVIATGKGHAVRDVLECAFRRVGLDYKEYITGSEALARPDDVAYLVGDPSKISSELGWSAQMGFKELVDLMVDEDIRELKGSARSLS